MSQRRMEGMEVKFHSVPRRLLEVSGQLDAQSPLSSGKEFTSPRRKMFQVKVSVP
jgi:hypothetical protein